MSRINHDAVNAVLRTAMAETLGDTGGGSWALYGCYRTGKKIAWCSLDALGDVVLDRAVRIGGAEALFAAVASVTADMPDHAHGVDLDGLEGVALVFTAGDAAGRRTCVADAAIVDGYRHMVKWDAWEAAPSWTIYSPADQQRREYPLPDLMPKLLASRKRPGPFDAIGHLYS